MTEHDCAINNYTRLREIGFSPERSSYYSAQWACHSVEIIGHRYDNGRLFARLSPHNGAPEYELELHLGGPQ